MAATGSVNVYVRGVGTAVLADSLADNAGSVDNQVAIISGKSSAGDGGEGLAVWDADSVETSDNATIWGSGTGRWKRVYGDELCANWWGLTKDSAGAVAAAANVTALQAAIDAGISKFRHVHILPGKYYFNSGLTIDSAYGFRLRGAGKGVNAGAGTILEVRNPTAVPIFINMLDCNKCYIEDFTIFGGPSYGEIVTAIQCSNVGGGSGSNTFKRLYMSGTTYQGLTNGFKFTHGVTGGIDGVNSENIFDECEVRQFSGTAFRFESGQCKANTFYNCLVDGASAANTASAVANQGYTPGSYGGSFRWINGSISNVGVCFDISTIADDMLISCCNMEANGQMLTTLGPGSAPGALTIQSCRFAQNGMDAGTPEIIDYQIDGPLNVIGCNFEYTSATSNGKIKFYSNGAGQINVIGCHFGTTNTSPIDCGAGSRANLLGNVRSDPATALTYEITNRVVPGNGTSRPSNPYVGETFFDSNLATPRPIWYKGSSVWVDATGASV